MIKNVFRNYSIFFLVLIIGIIYLFTKYQPFDFLNEFEELKVEIEDRSSPSTENTLKYEYEDKIDSLIEFNDLFRAELLLDSLLESDFINAEEWYFRKGKIFYKKNNFNVAIDYFSKAIEHSPRKFILAHLWRSYAYAKVKKCVLAFEDLDKIININSDYSSHKKEVIIICDIE